MISFLSERPPFLISVSEPYLFWKRWLNIHNSDSVKVRRVWFSTPSTVLPFVKWVSVMLQACEVPASQNEHSHYICTDNGEVKCLRGWTGDVCDVPICRKGCDPLQGYCKRPGECLCKLGMLATNIYIFVWRIHHCLNCLILMLIYSSTQKNIFWSMTRSPKLSLPFRFSD